ncbi:MAG TPA: Phenylacetic acid catabolic protein [Longimicrobiales bacterium]
MSTVETVLPAAVRNGVRDLVLVLADSKRLLGMRYAEWMLGAPELEASIACSSMAQDEWGHARLLYALLRDFGEDVQHVEHGREAEDYCNMEALDRAPESWPGLVALNALVDTALTTQLHALRDSSYAPLRQRVGKLLEEERFHGAHAAAWIKRLARSGPQARAAMAAALQELLPGVLRWFGPDSPRTSLAAAAVVDAEGDALRARFIERVRPLFEEVGLTAVVPAPDFNGFDEARRRCTRTGPDAETLVRVRGDKNRAFLMD